MKKALPLFISVLQALLNNSDMLVALIITYLVRAEKLGFPARLKSLKKSWDNLVASFKFV